MKENWNELGRHQTNGQAPDKRAGTRQMGRYQDQSTQSYLWNRMSVNILMEYVEYAEE